MHYCYVPEAVGIRFRRVRILVPLLVPLLVAVVASCAANPDGDNGPTVDREAIAEGALVEGRLLLDGGDPEGALTILDKALKHRYALTKATRGRFDLMFGEANLDFARRQAASGGDGTVIRGCLLDAESSLKNAAKTLADSPRPLALLAAAYLQQGKPDDAVEAASHAIDRTQPPEDGDIKRWKPEAFEPLVMRARARLRLLANARGEEKAEDKPGERPIRIAREILTDVSLALQLDGKRPEPYRLASHAYRWVKRPAAAIRMLEDGVRADPQQASHHVELQGLYVAQQRQTELVGLYRQLFRQLKPQNADVAWFLGHAHVTVADAARGKGDRADADKAYDAATTAFAQCAALNADYIHNCNLQRSLCTIAKARMALEEGDEEACEAGIDRAFAITPQIAALDADGFDVYWDGFDKTYRGSVDGLGARFLGSGGRLQEACRFFRKYTKQHGKWGFLWNNLGLACRDYGVQIERSGDTKEAMKLYEESFIAYGFAAGLMTTDPRVQNDYGLMLVYHLKRDIDFAVKQFEVAIDLGSAALAELPEKTDGEDTATKAKRQDLQEATGDAWQNWALVHRQRGETAAAIEKCKKAIDYYPYKRREAARWLRAMLRRQEDKKQVAAFWVPLAVGLTIPQDDHLQAAIDQLAADEPEEALNLVEPLFKKRGNDVEVWFVAGWASLAFARQRIRDKGEGVEANLLDAVTRLTKADELTRKIQGGSPHFKHRIHVLPVTRALEAMQLLARSDDAFALGQRHLTHLDSVGVTFAAEDLARLLTLTATSGVAKVVKMYQERKQPGAEIEKARTFCMRAADAIENLTPAAREPLAVEAQQLYTGWARLEEWGGRAVAAIRCCGRGARLLPEQQRNAVVGHMCAVAQRKKEGSAAMQEIDALLKDHPSDASLLWYRGYALVLRGNDFASGGDFAKAAKPYEQGRRALRQAMAKRPSFASSSNWWIAMSLNSQGSCASAQKDMQRAEKQWLEAIATHPPAAMTKDLVFQASAMLKVLELGGEHYRAGRYVEGVTLMERLNKALGQDNVTACQNIGFFLREHGTRSGLGDSAAKKVFRQSYAAYLRAVAVSPDDPRLLNDTALIDIYHLKQHAKASEHHLLHAIEVGTQRLENEPPEDARAKRMLEEAVGDAHMNLGLMLIDVPKRWTEAGQHLKKSFEYYPGQARASRGHLRRLRRLRRDAKVKK